MAQFIKNPIVIEAWQFFLDKPHNSDCATNNGPALPVGSCDCGACRTKPAWLDAAMAMDPNTPDEYGAVWLGGDDENMIYVSTLTGVVDAKPGDWIVQGVEGELSIVKPNIFAETYRDAMTDDETGHVSAALDRHDELFPTPDGSRQSDEFVLSNICRQWLERSRPTTAAATAM